MSHVGGDGHPGGRVELHAAGVGEQLPEVGLGHAAARHHADPLSAERRSVQLGDQFPKPRECMNYDDRLRFGASSKWD